MKKQLLLAGLLCAASVIVSAQSGNKGYYKDVFMDSGINLTSTVDLPVIRYLDLTMEAFISASPKNGETMTAIDTILQNAIFSGNSIDENGVLLYPDGGPRFRMIYVNGGGAGTHGKTLGKTGRDNLRKYVANGGSYLGSCAGAFLGSFGTIANKTPRETYLHIWPGQTGNTYLNRNDTGHLNYTGMFIEENSPILKYYDFEGDHHIDSVKHNMGCYADTGEMYPTGTEVLLRFDYPELVKDQSFHKKISAWAYKANRTSGRVILCGSHPEGVTEGEQLELMAAFVKYLFEGNGSPVLKGTLVNGEPRTMNCSTSDNNPEYTKLGDRQYHHFKVEVPKGVKQLTINLDAIKGWDNYDMYLFADNHTFAFMDNARYKNISLGFTKSITIDNPTEGALYISVFCATTVGTVDTRYGKQYTGRTDVLNGVPYIISVKY